MLSLQSRAVRALFYTPHVSVRPLGWGIGNVVYHPWEDRQTSALRRYRAFGGGEYIGERSPGNPDIARVSHVNMVSNNRRLNCGNRLETMFHEHMNNSPNRIVVSKHANASIKRKHRKHKPLLKPCNVAGIPIGE